jgi:hypothetical protein
MDEERTVKISILEYDAYAQDARTLEILLKAIELDACLDYGGRGLIFTKGVLDNIFKVVCPKTYQATMKRLQEEENAAD